MSVDCLPVNLKEDKMSVLNIVRLISVYVIKQQNKMLYKE